MSYDSHNVFARILRGEIPCKKLYEDDYALAFHDIAPSAPVHVLVIPKAPYRDYMDFVTHAAPEMLQGYFAAIRTVAVQLGVGENFRLITNNGAGAGQSVFHFHMHLLAGKPMGALVGE
jgi:histidine triad (HIT) family protein